MKDGKSRLFDHQGRRLRLCFLSLLKSRQLNYICNRMMAEPEELS